MAELIRANAQATRLAVVAEDPVAQVDLVAVGDVFLDRTDVDHPFDRVRRMFKSVSIVFGNQEGVYSDTTVRAPSSGIQLVVDGSKAAAIAAAGFTVMSCANNHIVDGGYEGLADTIASLEQHGVATVGAGKTIAEARKPRVIVREGVRIAFLAYSAVFPAGYDAKERRPGLAPIRADTFYAPPDPKQVEAPARVPRVLTVPFKPDVDDLRKDVAAAREQADVVLTSFHWGVWTRPFVVTEYEREYARVAIDAGATAVLGHHHHLLRGIELYRGKPIFYGLGHFVFDMPNFNARLTQTDLNRQLKEQPEYGLFERPDQPFMPMHKDTLKTMAVYLCFEGNAITYAGVLPCQIERDGSVTPLKTDSREGAEILDYLDRAGEDQGFGTCIARDGRASLDGFPLASVQLNAKSS